MGRQRASVCWGSDQQTDCVNGPDVHRTRAKYGDSLSVVQRDALHIAGVIAVNHHLRWGSFRAKDLLKALHQA